MVKRQNPGYQRRNTESLETVKLTSYFELYKVKSQNKL